MTHGLAFRTRRRRPRLNRLHACVTVGATPGVRRHRALHMGAMDILDVMPRTHGSRPTDTARRARSREMTAQPIKTVHRLVQGDARNLSWGGTGV